MNLGAERWSSVWEDDVADHAAIAALLAAAFPRSRTPFGGERSFSSARPELRLLASDRGEVVAHAGFLRRFVQVDGRAQLVGDVGLVAVHPTRHGSGLGAELLRRVAAALAGLEMPFGLLTCGEHVAGFYARGGWARVPGPVRQHHRHPAVDLHPAVGPDHPVCAPLAAWPVGRIDRNGPEV